MSDIRQLESVLNTSTPDKRLFFSLGNGEVQDRLLSNALSIGELERYINISFRVACLLFDFVLQPTAHYYVPVTRQISIKNAALFTDRDRIAAYVLGADVEDYKEDLDKKRGEYPTRNNLSLDDHTAKLITQELERLGPPIHRLGGIGTLTGQKWADAFEHDYLEILIRSFEDQRCFSAKQLDALILLLQQLPYQRGKRAFEWHFIRDELTKADLVPPDGIMRQLQRLLLDCYLASCRQLYAGFSIEDCTTQWYEATKGKHDPSFGKVDLRVLFDFSRLIGLSKLVEQLSAEQIALIRKDSLSLDGFRRLYFGIFDLAKRSTTDAVGLLKEEFRKENDLQLRGLKRLTQSSSPIIIETVRAYGLPNFSQAFMEPNDLQMYNIKNMLVGLGQRPLTEFIEELKVKFSRRLLSEAQEISRSLSHVRIFSNCSFIGCQIGTGNRLSAELGLMQKQIGKSMEDTVSEFNFSGGNKFYGCQFGDNNSMENFLNAMRNLDIRRGDPVLMAEKGSELRNEIEQDRDLDVNQKKKIVEALIRVFQELELEASSKPEATSRVQEYWNQIKQGVQTSAHLTTLVMAFGRIIDVF